MRKLTFVIVPLILAGLLAMPGTAEAKKKGGFIAYGDIYFEVGELPEVAGVTELVKKEPGLFGAKAGYNCKALIIVGAHMHKWKCKPILFLGTRYYSPDEDLSAERRKLLSKLTNAIEKKYKPGDIKANFWVKHGRVFLVLGILGLIGYGVWSTMNKGKKKKDKKKDA